jgi:hypothetical protein
LSSDGTIESILRELLSSKEPTVRLKTYLRLLDYEYDTKEVRILTKDLKNTSKAINNLFSYLPKDMKHKKINVYKKWLGIHWILADLADIGYPPGDNSLIPSREYEYQWLFSEQRWKKKKTIQGRKRFCASQEGNGLYSIVKLGIDDGRSEQLANRLIKYQWEDGGWNCDENPSAYNSSYHESLIPMRALNLVKDTSNRQNLQKAIDRAAELFLKRKLYKEFKSNKPVDQQWIKLHYPPYWRYDILIGLKTLAEANKIMDPRCCNALDLLESKRLVDGGFPAEGKHYKTSGKYGLSPVDWGGVNKRKMNEWVTIDAYYILKKAGRIDIED